MKAKCSGSIKVIMWPCSPGWQLSAAVSWGGGTSLWEEPLPQPLELGAWGAFPGVGLWQQNKWDPPGG